MFLDKRDKNKFFNRSSNSNKCNSIIIIISYLMLIYNMTWTYIGFVLSDNS